MSESETTVIDTKSIIDANMMEEVISISKDLEERGYEPVKQLLGYLTSGDPGYISSYKDCRNRITKYNREDILELMLSKFLNK
jgi:uncharacterized protein (UPF0297 family)